MNVRHQLQDRPVLWVAIPLVLLATSIVFLAVALIASASSTPLENIVPQEIAETGPFREHEVISVTAVKCNNSDKPIDVSVTAFWRDMESVTLRTIPYVTGVATRPVGCTTYHLTNPIPDLDPGVWRLEGTDTTSEGQVEPWYTENFEVVGD